MPSPRELWVMSEAEREFGSRPSGVITVNGRPMAYWLRGKDGDVQGLRESGGAATARRPGAAEVPGVHGAESARPEPASEAR